MSYCKNWVFTLNNYNQQQEETLKKLQQEGYIKYIIYGHEIAPTTGTPHLQGYIQLEKKSRLKTIKNKLQMETIYLEPAKGTIKDNQQYTTKDNNYIELGQPTIERQRTDINNFYEQIINCKNWEEVLKLNQTKQYYKYAKEVYKTINNKIEPQQNITLRPFQQKIIDIINQPADDRTIYWVYDPEGNTGKTFLSKYLLTNYNAFYFRPAKGTDILYQYNNQTIIILDIPRSTDEQYINWGILEQLKDGITFSGKYEGKTLYRKENAHIIVMSNELPVSGTFSKDRIKIITPDNINIEKPIKHKQSKLIEITTEDPLDYGIPKLTREEVKPILNNPEQYL